MTAQGRTRPMTQADIPAVVDAHLASFEGFFLSSLGPRFLSAFYAGLLDDGSSITLVAESDDGAVIGLAAGSSRPNGLIRRLASVQRWRFAQATLHAAFTQPRRLWGLVQRVRDSGGDEVPEGVAWLHALAVQPRRQGEGVGRDLLSAFCEAASANGATAVALETDAVQNEAVRAFYESQRFEITGTRTAPGEREMLEFTRRLAGEGQR